MTNPASYEYDIFLSHNRADEDWVAKLAERLEGEDWRGRKLKVFFSPWDIRPGQSIPKEIESALPKSRKVGLILSPEAMNSAWVELERLVTTYIAVSAREERLLPLYRRACEIPALLLPILYIDFRDDSGFEESYQRLLAAIKDEPPPRRARNSSPNTASPPSSIPRPPVIGFVARRNKDGRDIVECLREKLAPPQRQLVTLSGEGGIGKTTLAAEAARALSEAYEGRIVWSSADGRADFTLSMLLDDTATQLSREDLRPLPPDAKEAAVHALVADPPTLVVLDNYETIKPDAQQSIEAWFKDARCSALFTSRPRVGRVGETSNVAVAAMSPAEAQEFLEKVIAETQDAAQIFSEEVRQSIYKTAEANPFVMQWVVAQIDAAQEPRTVLEELQHGDGDAAERVFARSFNLPQLGDDGRAALLVLSLFAPSATRDALADVAGFGNDSQRLNEAVKNLRALWLIKALDQNRRFAVEGLTRSFAAARLSKDARAAEFRQRFVAYFLNYAKAHAQPTPEDFDALELDKDNLLSAMDAAFDSKDWTSVLDIGCILFVPVIGMLSVRGYWDEAIKRGEQAMEAAREMKQEWEIAQCAGNIATIRMNRGEYGEARKAYQQALDTFKKLGSDENVAVALHQLGRLAQAQGEIEDARGLYNESLEINKKFGDQSGIARTLHQLGRLAEIQGELEEARRLYNESLEINKKLGDQSGIASTTSQLGIVHYALAELSESKAKHEESLAIRRKLGEPQGIAIDLHQLGMLAQAQGGIEDARGLYNESLEIKKRLGDQSGIAITLHQLAMLARDQGELEEARELFNESLEIKKRLGNQSGIASTLHQLAMLAQAQGNLEEARGLYDENLEISKRLGNQNGIAITLGQLGLLAAEEGNKEESVRLMREAFNIFKKLKSPNAEIARRVLERLEGESS